MCQTTSTEWLDQNCHNTPDEMKRATDNSQFSSQLGSKKDVTSLEEYLNSVGVLMSGNVTSDDVLDNVDNITMDNSTMDLLPDDIWDEDVDNNRQSETLIGEDDGDNSTWSNSDAMKHLFQLLVQVESGNRALGEITYGMFCKLFI